MKTFTYTINDKNGLHARPAGNLSKLSKTFSSRCFLKKGDKETELTKLIALMGMGVKKGDEVIIRVEGEDEEAACNAIKEFFSSNL